MNQVRSVIWKELRELRAQSSDFGSAATVLMVVLVVGVVVVGLSVALSSPDDPPLTVRHVAATAPLTFVQTALGELNGTDSINTYGPPYNSGSGSVQSLGPVSLQRLVGVHIPINTAQDMVRGPLRDVARMEPAVAAALRTFDGATSARQAAWEAAYGAALTRARVQGASVRLPAGGYVPVAPMLAGLLDLGRAGPLEPAVGDHPRTYSPVVEREDSKVRAFREQVLDHLSVAPCPLQRVAESWRASWHPQSPADRRWTGGGLAPARVRKG